MSNKVFEQVDTRVIDRNDKIHIIAYASVGFIAVILAGLLTLKIANAADWTNPGDVWINRFGKETAYRLTPQERTQYFFEMFLPRLARGEVRLPTEYELLERKWERFPISIQREDWWCGPATIETVSSYYGKRVRQEEIGNRLYINRYSGMNWGQMKQEIKRAGLNSSEVFYTHGEMMKHLWQGHLVIVSYYPFNRPLFHYETLVGIKDGNMFLVDTEYGKHVMMLQVFYERRGLKTGGMAVWK